MKEPDICSVCIQIKERAGHIRFNLPEAITDTSKSKLKKILRFIVQNACQDETMISVLDDWFEYVVEYEKYLWVNASRIFRYEFVAPERGTTQKEQRQISTRNNQMYTKVTRHKKAYERLIERKKMYEDIKEDDR